ncbi:MULTISPECIES: response regulator transcription factor [Clostridium]|uniref:Response regulator n=1 Tax=Clostridium frigoriphilum TaxID=443253 RepID=A0ABU7UKE3_9CLOT|nr:response regulator [Clostridium sp. DSM 17811]MBU3099118.1 response regulator [Clostridium sp. DSM 17811]
MYKVLIVDDERIIREGIANSIEWNKYGFSLCGMAQNGIDAYEIIKQIVPEVVITDIKMPGMGGLELISRIYKEYPQIIFIILSGYGEFEFANKAMKYGVKYYLLKPCDEDEIIKILKKIAIEKKEKEKKDKFLTDINDNLKKVLPQVGEQFLRDFIIGVNYSKLECEYFLRLFDIKETKFKLVVFKLDNGVDLLEKFALKNIAYDILNQNVVYLSTILDNNILLLIKSIDLSMLTDLLSQIKDIFNKYFKYDICIGVSNENSFESIQKMYLEVKECLKCEFYLGDNKIITEKIIEFNKSQDNLNDSTYNEMIAVSVKTGNIESLNFQLDSFFHKIYQEKVEIEMAKNYCFEIFLIILRQGNHKEVSSYAKGLYEIQDKSTLKQISVYIKYIANEIAKKNFDNNTENYGAIISTVINCVENNIQNYELSLTWIAKKVLFINENYLGKLFYKHTNEKFSKYVVRLRMEKAIELIRSKKDYKVYEITEQIGFGDNTQYFSQVFKKYTGYTPSEYRKL